jgi:hypothetical protein
VSTNRWRRKAVVVSDHKVSSLEPGGWASVRSRLLLSGGKYRGEFEDRFKAVLKEIEESNGQIVLFIDEHELVAAAAVAGPAGHEDPRRRYPARLPCAQRLRSKLEQIQLRNP